MEDENLNTNLDPERILTSLLKTYDALPRITSVIVTDKKGIKIAEAVTPNEYCIKREFMTMLATVIVKADKDTERIILKKQDEHIIIIIREKILIFLVMDSLCDPRMIEDNTIPVVIKMIENTVKV